MPEARATKIAAAARVGYNPWHAAASGRSDVRPMKAYWNRRGQGVSSDQAFLVTADEASCLWSDAVGGSKGDFLGLIDDAGATIQFYIDENIPDYIDDATHLSIVLMDFPQPHLGGSYARHVKIGEVHKLIQRAFAIGADHRHFGELSFIRW